jgi:hypothetical protein
VWAATNLIYARLDKNGGEECPWIEETGTWYECEVWNRISGITFPLRVDVAEREQDSGGGDETRHWWN